MAEERHVHCRTRSQDFAAWPGREAAVVVAVEAGLAVAQALAAFGSHGVAVLEVSDLIREGDVCLQ
jgi:hypothetical protein